MRLFFCIDLPQNAVRSVLPVYEKLAKFDKLRLVPLQQLHCTLCFLGEQPLAELIEIDKKLATLKIAPFQVTLKGVGGFPSLADPAIVWLGLDSPELVQFSHELHALLNIKPQKPFRPHCTLARIKTPIDLREFEAYSEMVFSTFTCDAIYLKQSELTSKGSRYTVLRTYKP